MESPWGCWACRWHKGQAEMQRLGELKPEHLPTNEWDRESNRHGATRRQGQEQWRCHQHDGVGHGRDLKCRVTAAEGL